MYTLDTKQKVLLRNALIYTIVSVFCAFAGAVYEHYSHGVYSYYMIYAFGFSLAGGVLPSLILLSMKKPKLPNTYSRYFYHSAISVFIIGSIFKGVLDIYGTGSRLLKPYLIAGIALLILALICVFFKEKNEEKETEEKTGEIKEQPAEK